MASRATAEKWLAELTNLTTASGLEDEVVAWVERWVDRRDDLSLAKDSGGNLFITQKGRKEHDPVLAVAHMDHPAFVILDADGSFEFRGGVDAPYFDEALIDVVSRMDGPPGRVTSYDPDTHRGTANFVGVVVEGDIAMWRFRSIRQ
ncbi:MAG: hypothetical protein ACRDU9_03840, partial [Acidimicrobiia bacterium]